MLTATCLLGGPGITDRVTHGHDPDRFVQLGSLSKVMTGTVLMRLTDQGVIDLDTPLEDCLAEVPRGTGITLRHLAEHTSGLPRLPPGDTGPPDDPYAGFSDAALSEMLHDLDRVVVERPGAETYSNLGYAVLGRALTEVSGRTYQQLVDECVLEPLGLEAGTVTASPPADRRLVARTLFGRPRAPWTLTGPILPAGGLWSTPRTMAAVVVRLLVEHRLGPPAPTWRSGRNSSLLWHNGATRGASAIAVADDGGRWLLLHRLSSNGARTDRRAIKEFKASAPSTA
ncbi:serine hydrolase domain-containing protein [Streptomyces sp. NPDC029216]|uniref:serine hydrolase domain-containing protein n=1 Tax=Streptomyces sp. NPDC029216 TaxID=3154701 RepID=UPI0033F894ED